MNKYQETMDTALERAIMQLRQAQAKVKAGDIHGAQARVNQGQQALCEFTEESIACPKTETGYVR